jgi:predicted RecA/RadA family phage recombinase
MATNYVNEGDVIPIPAPYAVTSGSVVISGKIIGIAATDMASGQVLQLQVEGHFDVPKTATHTYNVGDVVKVDPATRLASTAAGGTATFGYCTRAALAADTVVRTKLVPTTV